MCESETMSEVGVALLLGDMKVEEIHRYMEIRDQE